LQSVNEELETSKEESQSTNEEIVIINKELVDHNVQLNNAWLYAEGIVSTIRDSLIIMDKDLCVKRATDGFYKKFKLSQKETEGSYFYELNNRQWDIPVLRELLEGVLPKKNCGRSRNRTGFFAYRAAHFVYERQPARKCSR